MIDHDQWRKPEIRHERMVCSIGYDYSTGEYMIGETMVGNGNKTRKWQFGRAAFNVLRALLVVSGLLTLLVLRGCVVRPATSYPGSHFNRGQNAAWIGVEWVNEVHTTNEIKALADDLKQHQIVYVFAYTSYLKDSGVFNPTYAHAADFIRTLKAAQPDLKVLAWIGLPLSYVDLGNASVRQKVKTFCADVVSQSGFDGLHLDPENIADGDQNVLALLDETRQAIGPHMILSIATQKAWPVFADAPPSQWIGPILWSSGYFREVARRVDQVAVMIYDSGLASPLLYRQWSRFQVIQVSKALAESHIQLFFGVPTSEEETPTHHVSGENITSGLTGIIDGLNDDEARPDAVTGVAIYPYWETDAAKWAGYNQAWLGQ
jgi:hypothetical protein